jgi:hypothetical protein
MDGEEVKTVIQWIAEELKKQPKWKWPYKIVLYIAAFPLILFLYYFYPRGDC